MRHTANIYYENEVYAGIKLDVDGGSSIKFNTGDPVIDYLDLKMFHILIGGYITFLSSYDHFFFDHDDYYERYVNLKDPEQKFYTTDEVLAIDFNGGFKVIAHKDHKTFMEVKEHYINNKEFAVYDIKSSDTGETIEVALTRQYAQSMSSPLVNIENERNEKINTSRTYSVENVNQFVRTYPVYRRIVFNTPDGHYVVPDNVIYQDEN